MSIQHKVFPCRKLDSDSSGRSPVEKSPQAHGWATTVIVKRHAYNMQVLGASYGYFGLERVLWGERRRGVGDERGEKLLRGAGSGGEFCRQ